MLKKILDTFANCFRIPELRSRILFTLGLLAVCRIIAYVPIPGLDGAALAEFFRQNASKMGGLLGMYSLFTGGAFERCAVGSLGIMPYISATIILQLLAAVIPQLSKMMREEHGRIKIIQYGRYLTVLLCLGQGFVMALGWEHPDRIFGTDFPGGLVLMENVWWYRIQTALLLTTGTILLMWLGEQISDRGIGNGVSLVITIGIIARLPAAVSAAYIMFFPPGGQSRYNIFHAIAMILLLVAVVAGIVAVTQAQRKIPVQYAQRTIGRRVYAGTTSFMPLRVSYAGVMPIIFAQAVMMFPRSIFSWGARIVQESSPAFGRLLEGIAAALQYGTFTYMTIEGILIFFFSYFWVATQFNEVQIADDLKKYGGYIPGVRPGQQTSEFLHRAMSRITFGGAVFLVIIALIPGLMYKLAQVPPLVAQFFGGTSMLIIVGVLLDTIRQIESHLMMRHYDGFLKKGRVRARF